MAAWQPKLLREAELSEIEARLRQEPDTLALQFEQARLFHELGRMEEARQVYLEVLSRDPSHFVALNNLAAILHETGYRTASLLACREVVARHSTNVTGLVNLAQALYSAGHLEEARQHYEKVLELDPDHVVAHQGLSYLLIDLQDEEAARIHREKGFGNRPFSVLRYRGEEPPVQVLLLASTLGGNAPFQKFLDDRMFLTTQVLVEFYDPSQPLPPHHLVINSISDADRCAEGLSAASRLLVQTEAPVINSPERIRLTGRVENARRLSTLEGVVIPRIATVLRERLETSNAPVSLAEQGFAFPILLRSPGFHGGEYFLKVDDPSGLPSALGHLLGEELSILEYLNCRNEDGKIRKFRVMMIDGRIYPVHTAVSSNWKIHYFTAEMADSSPHRSEDAAFLNDMEGVIGSQSMRALKQIRELLCLDYVGVDFSLGPNGRMVIFEANATMNVVRPSEEEQWGYRRAPIERVYQAVREMCVSRANI